MSSPIDVRVPPIFQNHQQLGDFVMPTSSYNSFVSKYEKAKYLFNSEFCNTEGLKIVKINFNLYLEGTVFPTH